jgi:formate dehydrogenase maturation protein FdhE
MAGMNTILLIRKIFAAEDRVVEYRPGETICPVCQYLGLPPVLPSVTKTVEGIRYCDCPQCHAGFRAAGATATEIRAEKAESEKAAIEIERQIKEKKTVRKKKRK